MHGSPHHRPEHLFSGLAKLVDRLSVPDEDAAVFADNLNTFTTHISNPQKAEHFRGYSLNELARKNTFLDTSYLLLYGAIPNQEELADFQSILTETAELPSPIADIIQQTPLHVDASEFIRSVCALLPLFDSQSKSGAEESVLWQAHKLLMHIPLILIERQRLVEGWQSAKFDPDIHWAVNLAQLLTNRTPTPLGERAFEVLLLSRAELGYDAASHAARLVASRGGNLYSAISTAMNSIPLDDWQEERSLAIEVLAEGNQFATEKWARSLTPGQARKLGFGADIEKESVRLQLFNTFCYYLAEENNMIPMEKAARRSEKLIFELTGLSPHSEWAATRILYYLGIDIELNQPLQLMSRIPGWTAHVLEQLQQGPLVPARLEYEGPIHRYEK
ncbi:Citrate synthase 2 [Polystyrenella longa]|uniref:citrate synthase (unknown stereospecificity) n=1 Tax=Polystyrenella longa TaxID=2528007 RepID=A0A518CP69_9PLAN|nr:citrate/2-methylcitrate synthase [Polystyrenella longa]QDU81015.1 Citrate synthase 2 [Polystyrenella longa]